MTQVRTVEVEAQRCTASNCRCIMSFKASPPLCAGSRQGDGSAAKASGRNSLFREHLYLERGSVPVCGARPFCAGSLTTLRRSAPSLLLPERTNFYPKEVEIVERTARRPFLE